MKIVHVVESFAGGVLDFLVDLTNGMPKYNHTILYAKREHTPKDFQSLFPKDTNFILWEKASREINPIQDFLALKELIENLKNLSDVDVIHLHSSKAGFLGRVASRWLGLQNRIVYTPHGVSFLRRDVSPTKQKLFVWLEKLGYWCGGKVVGCSHSEAKSFHKYNIKANSINNGINCQGQYPIQSRHSVSTIKIAAIGRITYQKNPTLFNEIAQTFVDDKHIEFIWIGDGELRHQLTSPNITVTGWVTRKDVENFMQTIDIYLSTSLWEGLPLSVLQAMCCEKPLILSRCVGNMDLVQECENGYLYEKSSDAIEKLSYLIDNKERRHTMGTKSKEIVQKDFSINKMVDHYKRLYSTISNNPKVNK